MQDDVLESMLETAAEKTEDKNMQKYLTFKSGELVYGITIENVVEIITNHTITKLPMVPDYVLGIMNLRGQIVPVVDIKQLMSRRICEKTSDTCIIILEVEKVSIGIMVDTVLQVINIKNTISAPPSKNHEFVNGMINLPDGTVMFCLDCELLINTK